MARIDNLTNFLTDVATSIKAKTGDSSLIPASQFDTKIAGITTGKLSNEEYTKANNNLDEILYQSQNVLPNTYQEVEYLESTGTQYIDTGYTFTNPNFKIELKYQKNTSLATNVFGVDTRVTPRQMHGNIYNRTFYLGNSSVVNNVTQELNTDYDYTVVFNENGAYFKLNENEYSYTGTTAWNGASLSDYLFTSHQTEAGGTLYNMKGRIYYARFYNENNVMVRNFIPCYRKSDNEAGMYDTINNVFYTNEGTGDFVVGENVDVLNTKIESILTEKIMKISPENIKSGVEILGIEGEYTGNLTNTEYQEANDDLDDILEGSTPTKVYPPDWSEIGYEDTPQDILDGFNVAKEIKDNWDNTTTNMLDMFKNRKDIFIFPMIDTSNVTNMNSVFYSSSIKIVPVLETKNVIYFYDTFGYCNQLEPNSLNNIMQMCINATSYTRTKTLKYIGLSSTQAEICQTLSNYQAFLDAGWTTGY